MLFKGDLSKYHPADAMAFLSQVGIDGVLTIADQDQLFTLTIKSGQLLDAQSAFGDQKLLRCLQHEGRLNDSQIRQVQQIQRETGLSVREIIAKLAFFDLKDIRPLISTSMLEVLRQLFLLDSGSFNFTETPVEDDGAGIRLDTGKVSLTVLPQADEYRDFIKTIHSTQRVLQLNGTAKTVEQANPAERLILNLAQHQSTIQDVLDKSPLPSHTTLQHIQQFLTRGVLTLGAVPKTLPPSAEPALNPMFAAFKQALKTLLSNGEVLPRLGAMISFGKIYYDVMLILTAKQGEVIHCKSIHATPDKGLAQKSLKGRLGLIDTDPVFATVNRSGVAFFGKTFPSKLLDQFFEQTPNGDCALIPVLGSPNLSMFLYAYTAKTFDGITPHHYLELLSWIIAPTRPAISAPVAAPVVAAEPPPAAGETSVAAPPAAPVADTQKRIARMVSRINDLPPLPTLVSKALQLLANPETPIEEIAAVIGQDQALVAKLIKVGNSALYGGLQKATSLRQVLARLGLKTTRNLVLAASTRSYFMGNRKGMRVWGQFLWQHSVESGLAARRIAQAAKYPDPEEAFIGGLVHDIGKLIILMLFPEPYKEILKLKKVHQVANKPAEAKVIGCDHEQVGRLLMDRWNMPDSAKACAEFHHRYQEAGAYADLAAIVAYADYLSRQYGTNPESLPTDDQAQARDISNYLKLSDTDQAALTEAVVDDFQNAEMMME
jgi:HD-like signal output (HDOD) protein